jgi:hypothetical protein
MAQFFKTYISHNLWFYIFSGVAMGLVIASFIVPPTGVIDPSVLAATGEIFAFAALGAVIKAIDKGVDAKVQRGNTTLVVGDLNSKDGEQQLLLEQE